MMLANKADKASQVIASDRLLMVATIYLASRRRGVCVMAKSLSKFDGSSFPDENEAKIALSNLVAIGVAEQVRVKAGGAIRYPTERIGWTLTEVGRSALRIAYENRKSDEL